MVDAFDQARTAIVEIAAATAEMVERPAERAARPDRLEVEFGFKVTASGNVVVAGAAAEASLRVTLFYDAQTPAR